MNVSSNLSANNSFHLSLTAIGGGEGGTSTVVSFAWAKLALNFMP